MCSFLLEHSIGFITQQEQVRVTCEAAVYTLKLYLTPPTNNTCT